MTGAMHHAHPGLVASVLLISLAFASAQNPYPSVVGPGQACPIPEENYDPPINVISAAGPLSAALSQPCQAAIYTLISCLSDLSFKEGCCQEDCANALKNAIETTGECVTEVFQTVCKLAKADENVAAFAPALYNTYRRCISGQTIDTSDCDAIGNPPAQSSPPPPALPPPSNPPPSNPPPSHPPPSHPPPSHPPPSPSPNPSPNPSPSPSPSPAPIKFPNPSPAPSPTPTGPKPTPSPSGGGVTVTAWKRLFNRLKSNPRSPPSPKRPSPPKKSPPSPSS